MIQTICGNFLELLYKLSQTGGLMGNLFVCRFRGQKSNIKVLAELAPSEASERESGWCLKIYRSTIETL